MIDQPRGARCSVSVCGAQGSPVEDAWALLAEGQRPQAIRIALLAREPDASYAHYLLAKVSPSRKTFQKAAAQL